jgi:hypothetical protein
MAATNDSGRYNVVTGIDSWERKMNEIPRAVVEVDVAKCERLADILRTRSIPVDKEDTDLPGFSGDEIGNLYLFLVAVCHQTSPPGVPPLEGFVAGVRKRGWDYLSAKFEAAAGLDRALIQPTRWAQMDHREFANLFRDPTFGDRLSDPLSRAALVENLGRVMIKNDWTWIQEAFDLCRSRVSTGNPHLTAVLAEFRAYDDPVRKKSFFFLSLMRNAGIWKYDDDAQLGPPVDYHEVRGHLRIGTVRVIDGILRRKLYDRKPVTASEDIAIRGAVLDAIMLLSDLTGLQNPSQLHYLFWNFFLSCCTRENPHCHACPTDCSLPERYVELAIHSDGRRRCPFAPVCSSVDVAHRYYEHVFSTDYY